MTRIEAVIFDMDGVLIDARDLHFEALNHALSLFGMEILRDEHEVIYDGLPTRRKLELLSKSRGLPVGLHGLLNTVKQRRTIEIGYERCRPRFEHQFALSRLRDDGMRLAVCSNSIRATVDTLLGLAGLDDYLEFSMSNEDTVTPKPDPETSRVSIERLGLSPQSWLIVEDNEHGLPCCSWQRRPRAGRQFSR
jgi:beta-phosphoglucomutase-like phosphatase (HAD superfamily)